MSFRSDTEHMPVYEVFERQDQFKVYADGQYLAAIQQGRFRPYIYPLRTVRGHVVTQAGPVDHPHHLSIWVAHGDVNGLNFWAPEVLDIAPAPRILVRDTSADVTARGVTFDQAIEWVVNGDEHLALFERRRTVVQLWEGHVAVDVSSTLKAPGQPVELGSTKEAGLAVRVADQIDVLDGGDIRSATGARGEAQTFDTQADWVDYSGPITRDQVAGIAVFPYPDVADTPWFTRDYGPIYVGPWRHGAMTLAPGECFTVAARFVAHDGGPDEVDINGLFRKFRAEMTSGQ